MSHGLGSQQREIKQILDRAALLPSRTLSLAGLRAVLVLQRGGDPDRNVMAAARERSLKRALKALVDRGEVVIVHGRGSPGDPYRYTTVERLASATGREVKDTAHAKQIVADMIVAASAFQAKLPGTSTGSRRRPRNNILHPAPACGTIQAVSPDCSALVRP